MSTSSSKNETLPASSEAADQSTSLEAQANAVKAAVDRVMTSGELDAVSEMAVREMLTAAVKIYAAKVDASGSFPAFARDNSVTATDVMVASSAMLKAVNLEVFELGMWRTFTGG